MKTHKSSRIVAKNISKITSEDVEVFKIIFSMVLSVAVVFYLTTYNIEELGWKDVFLMLGCVLYSFGFCHYWTNCRLWVRLFPAFISLLPFIGGYIFTINMYSWCYWAFSLLLCTGSMMAYYDIEEKKSYSYIEKAEAEYAKEKEKEILMKKLSCENKNTKVINKTDKVLYRKSV